MNPITNGWVCNDEIRTNKSTFGIKYTLYDNKGRKLEKLKKNRLPVNKYSC